MRRRDAVHGADGVAAVSSYHSVSGGVMSSFGLDRIFAPRRVAIVGASRRPTSIGALILKNIQNGGFAGEIAVVNPKYGAIDGVATSPDLKSLSFVPDLIVI